jgi:nicotinamidase/pyrazinamidase
MKRALVLVDLQNDFLPGGALAVAEGDTAVTVAQALLPLFANDFVVATQDWHPADHGSFAANHPGKKPGEVIELAGLRQVLWPVHCVQHTRGAEFASSLPRQRIDQVVQKGTDPAIDSYSGFFDNGHRRATGLHDLLQQRGIGKLFILGLATDYCVKFTVLDARELGYQVHLVTDGCRGVNLSPGDTEAAVEQMRQAGAGLTTSAALGAA